MLTGTIKDWNMARGFGFIKPDDGAKDVFVHWCALADNRRDYLPIGAAVQFETETDPRNGKLRAIKVAELNGQKETRHAPSPREAAEAIFNEATGQ